MENCESRW